MGNTEAIQKAYPVTCPACKGNKGKNMAVYRASYFHDHNNSERVMFEEQFDKYLHNRTDKECQYVSCHECVTEEIKKKFRFLPYGWKEAVGTHITYEAIIGTVSPIK